MITYIPDSIISRQEATAEMSVTSGFGHARLDDNASGCASPEIEDYFVAHVSIPSIRSKWLPMDEKRFNTLALKEAKGKLDPKEGVELNALERDRNVLICPRSAAEIEADLRASTATKHLVEALSKYVSFFGQSKKTNFRR